MIDISFCFDLVVPDSVEHWDSKPRVSWGCCGRLGLESSRYQIFPTFAFSVRPSYLLHFHIFVAPGALKLQLRPWGRGIVWGLHGREPVDKAVRWQMPTYTLLVLTKPSIRCRPWLVSIWADILNCAWEGAASQESRPTAWRKKCRAFRQVCFWACLPLAYLIRTPRPAIVDLFHPSVGLALFEERKSAD